MSIISDLKNTVTPKRNKEKERIVSGGVSGSRSKSPLNKAKNPSNSMAVISKNSVDNKSKTPTRASANRTPTRSTTPTRTKTPTRSKTPTKNNQKT